MSTGSPANHYRATARAAGMGVLLWFSWCAGPLGAVEIRVQVAAGESSGGVAGTVVSLHPAAGAPAPRASTAVMDQRASAFVPRVLPVQVGARVSFPNYDPIRHQVYSFSKAKRFELPLYGGAIAPPVDFDTPGVVVVGCNIHDGMIGYVIVLDTPYFSRVNDAGESVIDAPPGTYRLRAWHARMKGPALDRTLVVAANRPQAVAIELDLPAAQTRTGNRGLRALKEKLRRMQAKP